MDTKLFIKTRYKCLKVHNNKTVYLIDFRIEGKRYRKQITASTLDEAYNTLNTYRKEIEKSLTIIVDINATVSFYWERLIDTKDWKETMIKDYTYYFNKHLKQLHKLKVTDIRASHFTSLNVSLKHLSTRTRRTAYEILKPLFDLAIEDELIDKSPIKKSHIPVRKQLEEKKIITHAESKYQSIYNTINVLFNSNEVINGVQCNINPHHLALFLFGFHGRRLKETTSLKWSDIDFSNNTYIVRGENSKVNTDMVFQLPPDVRTALNSIEEVNEYVFQTKYLKGHYKTIRIISGIEDFSYHWMRNLSVSALASRGVDVTHLSAMLGHNDAGTLKKYLSLQRQSSTYITNDMSQQILEHGSSQDLIGIINP